MLIDGTNLQKISEDLSLKNDGKFAICFNHIVQSLLVGDSLKAKKRIFEALDDANNEDDEIKCIFVKFLDDKWLKCGLFEGSDFLIE